MTHFLGIEYSLNVQSQHIAIHSYYADISAQAMVHMASQFRPGGKRSSISLIQVLSSQNDTLRGEDEAAPTLKEDASLLEPEPSQLETPHGQQALQRVALYENLLTKAKAGTATQQHIEETLNNLQVPDIDETGFFLSTEGRPYQDRIDSSVNELAALYPNAVVDGSPLSFKSAIIPLYEALRNKRETKIPAIAKGILEQYQGQDFKALAWIRSLAAR